MSSASFSSSHHPSPQGKDLPPRRNSLTTSLIFLGVVVIVSMTFFQIRNAQTERSNGLEHYQRIPDFVLTAQDGSSVSLADLKGKIWVADFIFTHCKGPCPVLSARMAELQKEIQKSGVEGIQLVSISVDPERDTPEVLAAYAKNFQADRSYWKFLTGGKEEIQDLVENGFREGLFPGGEDGPEHATQFVLVDGNGVVRALHSGLEPHAVQKVLIDIGKLVRERKKL